MTSFNAHLVDNVPEPTLYTGPICKLIRNKIISTKEFMITFFFLIHLSTDKMEYKIASSKNVSDFAKSVRKPNFNEMHNFIKFS